MVAQPTEMLLVSANNIKLLSDLKEEAYRIHKIDDPGRAMETLRDTPFDLIMLDDALFGSEIVGAVQEIKRRVPLVPVLVLSGNTDAAYQTDLMEAGADDFLTANLSSDELHRRLRLLLRQRRQNRALARRTANLQAITTLSRRIHSASDPHTLIQDTIDIACSTFTLYGMAIVLGEGDMFQLYAGAEGGNATLYESTIYPHEYDPFRRAIQSGFVQIFQDINADPYFTPIPVLPRPESAIIVPLNYQDYKFGAMAVFGTPRHPLGNDDLLIYELFAGQFTLALHNARYYHSQHISVQFSQHLLKAWQRFVLLQNFDDIAQTLHQFVEDVPNVGKALVWLYSSGESAEMIVKAADDEGRKIFAQLYEQGHIEELLNQMDERRLQPLMLQPRPGQKDPLGPLFRYLRGQQLVFVPVTDSARLIGGVIASVVTSRQYTAEDARLLIESLTHAAGQALERTTLVAAMMEKSGRLEALLLSVSEGIFFVDETDRVVFANPQFSELTGIAPSRVLGQGPGMLLDALAEQARDSERVREQLHHAITSVLSPHAEAGNYPIVEFRLDDQHRDLHIEFLNISNLNLGEAGWAGIVRDKSRFQSIQNPQSALLDVMSEQIRLPYAQLRGLLNTLGEQHSRFTHRERARFLRQIEESVENLGQLWENFLEVYTLEVAGAKLNREETDLYDLVHRVLDSRAFGEYRRQIHVEAPAQLPLVEVDELRIEQVLLNILHNAINFSPKGASILITLDSQGQQVFLSVKDQGVGIPQDQLEKVFEPFYRASNNPSEEGAGLGLYLSRELIRRHGGEMWADSAPGKGTTITFTIPALGEEITVTPVPSSHTTITQQMRRLEETKERTRTVGAVRVTERQPQTIMVVEGQSSLVQTLMERLDAQGYEMIVYGSGEEALRDVNSVRLDLILVDVNLSDVNGLDICERICKRTEVPIILLADEASEAEKVRALNIGADDYIARPISNDELMARVNVIFKRRRIPDRQREPLDLGSLYIDFARREVYLNNKPLELTRIEYDLLHTLSVNMGQVLTHKQLLEKVWGPEYQAETQYLWVNVSRLRKKLEPTPDSPRFIQTQPGVGYVFRAP